MFSLGPVGYGRRSISIAASMEASRHIPVAGLKRQYDPFSEV